MAEVNKQNGFQPSEDPLFDHVIFCTNVTYADGGFKSGMYRFLRSAQYLSSKFD